MPTVSEHMASRFGAANQHGKYQKQLVGQAQVKQSERFDCRVRVTRLTSLLTLALTGLTLSHASQAAEISVQDFEVNESQQQALVSVQMSEAITDTVSFNFSTQPDTAINGKDFYGTFETIQFAPGETVKRIPVTILNDTEVESEERFNVRIWGAEGVAIQRAVATVIIVDDDDGGPGDEIDLTLKPSEDEASLFLMAASFGPTQQTIEELVDIGYSDWLLSQEAKPIDRIIPDINPNFADKTNYKWEGLARAQWYDRAVFGDDQLRQRAAFALSQIFVISTEPRDWLFKTFLQARYMDIMQEAAFGNFRDLMEEVTYSPLMGEWLTYIGNEKANSETGSVPDENYAREIMQLFTIGLVELQDNGQPVLDSSGNEIETYSTEDVSGLSRVFTGLWWAERRFGEDASRLANDSIGVTLLQHRPSSSPVP